MRIVIHLDMDAFFASVEIRDRPELADKPVIIGADPKNGYGRGVVSTCNYPARKYGVHSGMPISIAWRKCSNAVFLPVNMRKYYAVSAKVMETAKKHAEKFEQGGVDEAFIEVHGSFDEAVEIAKKIKNEIKQQENLTCSIGVASNKLVAKIASDFKKPDSLTIVKPDDALKFLGPMDCRKIPGIGPKTEAALKERGIEKISQLRQTPLFALKEWFGEKGGLNLYESARGIDDSPLEGERKPKSAGAEHTFESDVDAADKMKIYGVLAQMAREVVKSLEGQKFKTVVVKVRYENFETHTAQRSVKKGMNFYEEALEIAKSLAEPYLKPERKIRLVGFRVQGLEKGG